MEKLDIASPEWNDVLGRIAALQIALHTLVKLSPQDVKTAFKEQFPVNVEAQLHNKVTILAGHYWLGGFRAETSRLMQILD